MLFFYAHTAQKQILLQRILQHQTAICGLSLLSVIHDSLKAELKT